MRTRTFLTAALLILGGQFAAKGQAKPRPNILFAIMDDATWLHMSAYGCQWVSTPAFDRIASGGLLFNRAYTPNAKCAPSRSNILTGRNSWQLKEAANHWPDFPPDIAVFTEALAANGYHVGFTGKGWAPGYARHADGSNRQLLVKAWNGQRTTPPTTGISNIDYAANFEKFLDGRTGKEPFFFWYGGTEPHRGYEYRSGITKGKKNVRQVPASDVFRFWPDTDSVKEDLLDYAYEIEYFINFGKRPEEELYNIKTDPDCMLNLAASEKSSALKKQLRTELFTALKAEGDPRMNGNGDVFDRYPYMDKGSAHFYERMMRGERPKSGWVSPADFQDVSGIEKVQESLKRLLRP